MTDRTTTPAGRQRVFKPASSSRKLAYALAFAAVAAGIATAATMTGTFAQSYNVGTVVSLLYVDGILLLALSAVIARRMVQLWRERQRGEAGAGLHGRLVLMFSLVAVTPAILVAIFSALYLNFGLQNWFSERINTAINQSRVIANAYLREHRSTVRADALAIANDLNFNASRLSGNPYALNNFLSSHATFRSLSETVVIDGRGKVLGRARFSLAGDTVSGITRAQFNETEKGEIVVLRSASADQVRALMKLNRFIDSYLLVERFVDPQISGYVDQVNEMVRQYKALEENRGKFQISFVMIFVMLALLLLMAAAWVGLTVSNQLASPISRLIMASEAVRDGDLSVRVETSDEPDEIGTLTKTFNTMTTQLETQRDGLIEANRELAERHRFTETVLSGVSAGVIGLDKDGNVHLHNRSASMLLSTDLKTTLGQPLADIVPEMEPLLSDIKRDNSRLRQDELHLHRDNEAKTLHVRIASERLAGETIGYVVTFDDVTDLLSAQRKAAWADVARRIAHEIKNPLTPIQLSAERLKRKYVREISTDPEVFTTCTDTIVRQVEDIGRMVDEFSAFARMPEPLMKMENLSELCRQAIFLEQNRNPDIQFVSSLPEEDVELCCDARQVSRALTNLLKNAAESVAAALEHNQKGTAKGQIELSVSSTSGKSTAKPAPVATVTITDNGIGLPSGSKDRLTEPYVTTRTKGTGLGLAIVKKIMEEHQGELILSDAPEQGARIALVFPAPREGTDTEPGNDGDAKFDPVKAEIDLALRSAGE